MSHRFYLTLFPRFYFCRTGTQAFLSLSYKWQAAPRRRWKRLADRRGPANGSGQAGADGPSHSPRARPAPPAPTLYYFWSKTHLHLSPYGLHGVGNTAPKTRRFEPREPAFPRSRNSQGPVFAVISKMTRRHCSSFPRLLKTHQQATLTIYSTGEPRKGVFCDTALHSKFFFLSSQTKLLSDAKYRRARLQMLERFPATLGALLLTS